MNYLKVKDFSVSKEEFELKINEEFGFLETHPQPKKESLSKYYESDEYISHTNTKRNLFEKAYHFVRETTIKKKLKLINSFGFKDKTILDIGCGTGHFLQICDKNGWQITGVEPDESAKKIANSITNNSVKDIETLYSFEKNSFDVITLWHVLEHLPDLEKQVKLFEKLLKPDGRLIIAVPNHKSFDAKYYKSFWAAYDVPRHLWHFNRESIERLMGKLNLKLIKTLPLWFDSFYVSMLSEKHKTGKMNMIKAICIGLWSNLKALGSKEVSSHIYIIKKA